MGGVFYYVRFTMLFGSSPRERRAMFSHIMAEGTMFVYSGPLSYVMGEIIDTQFDDHSGYDHEIISRKQQLMPKLSVILKQM